DLLHECGITVNRNAVPNDPRPPMVTSGLRIGTPALATRGFGDEQFAEVADIIATALVEGAAAAVVARRDRVRGAALSDDVDVDSLRARTAALAEQFPLYQALEADQAEGLDQA
ncbi:MAG: hypothetical protein FWD11_09830, partial [Micrococcales bacterium]|nr:hypothetical protein [Micrococcales bacterium]